MLALTRKTDYALIALAYLVERHAEGEQPVSAKQIAQTFGLPAPLLMNILKELAGAKVLSSTRGPHGGYQLASDPASLTLLEVVTALEGPVRMTACSGGLPVMGQGCELSSNCPIRGTVRALHDKINRFLGDMTLQDLHDERQNSANQTSNQTDRCQCEDRSEQPQPVADTRQTV